MNDAFGTPRTVVVLGGSSDVAAAVCRRLAGAGSERLVLAGRDGARLARRVEEASREGWTAVSTVAFDAAEAGEAPSTVGRCFEAAGADVDLVVMAVGVLGDQPADEASGARVAASLTVNCTWPSAALAEAARRLQEQGHGRILVLSSVAGVRVRRANFVYGAGKAGLDAFALGLAESLRGTGVVVQVVRPGFVHSTMTAGRPPAPLAVDPDAVARAVMAALAGGRTVVWVPGALRVVFALFRLLPAAVWRRLPG